MKKLIKEYKPELRVLLLAFLFAAIGDLFYGGAIGAEASLVGIILGSVSTFLFTVFTIMVLYKLLMAFFVSEKFHGMIRKMPCDEPEIKTRRTKK
ncbi:hypothetical protein LCGC14_0622480 [marine sediment metagenome]|uniref:Uncharacterized protein n=1 Tax=marine sediment metagenome TaxID=412755 RepID=A0A0F9RNN5_9ZZZZ